MEHSCNAPRNTAAHRVSPTVPETSICLDRGLTDPSVHIQTWILSDIFSKMNEKSLSLQGKQLMLLAASHKTGAFQQKKFGKHVSITEGLKAHPHLDTFLKISVAVTNVACKKQTNQPTWMLKGVPSWKLSLPG